jgi:hypothetical protein
LIDLEEAEPGEWWIVDGECDPWRALERFSGDAIDVLGLTGEQIKVQALSDRL